MGERWIRSNHYVESLEPKYDLADPHWKPRRAWPSRPRDWRANSRTRGSIAALREAAAAAEPELRQVAVYALGFLDGEDSLKALRERLQSDDNRFVRYNAAVALGRRGDLAATATLKEMLSSESLERVLELPNSTERQNRIEAIESEALQAIGFSLSNRSPDLARSLRGEIEGLSRSGLVSIRSQAQELLQKLQSGS